MGWLFAFGLGYFFGRNPGAGQQLIRQGSQLLDAQTGQPVAQTVLPNTNIVGPTEVTPSCPDGQIWQQYPGGGAGAGQCMSQQAAQVVRALGPIARSR